ncbi:MAG TPA: hypothetical protein PKD00_06570 [Burkholderiales bacterium]|nr:hypothetical protein [Burkholderiales bacterium]
MIKINRNIELKASLEWIKLSFIIFREKPLQFILLGLVNFLMGLLPLFGAFMSPLFIARFAQLTEKVQHNEDIKVSSIFKNLFINRTIVNLAFINFFLYAIILIMQTLLENMLDSYGVSNKITRFEIMSLFFIPVLILQMAMWLSPIICLYNEVKPSTAMWLSIKAGLYNIQTLLMYAILILGFTALAILPIGLGLIIWLPILNITNYFVYQYMYKNE